MAEKLTTEQLEHIIVLTESGLTLRKAAEILGVSEYSVGVTAQIYRNLKDGTPLPKHAERTPGTIKWACEKLGKDFDAVMGKAPKEEPKDDNTALAFASLLEAVKALTSSVDAIDKRLSAMQMTIAGARGDASENTKKIVEAININGDIQTKEWQAIKEKLDAIKTNTKTAVRKGYEP